MEVPDNWNWDKVWNVPLDEFMQIIDNSLEKGYTISWGTDVSEKGFSRTKGLGIVLKPTSKACREPKPRSGANSPRRRRTRRSTSSTNPAGAHRHAGASPKGYDNYETTDDHGMQIVGTATDQNGTPYYKVKNSWNTTESLRRLLVFLAPVRRLQDDDRAGQQKRRSEGHSQENRRQIDRRSRNDKTARLAKAGLFVYRSLSF